MLFGSKTKAEEIDELWASLDAKYSAALKRGKSDPPDTELPVALHIFCTSAFVLILII